MCLNKRLQINLKLVWTGIKSQLFLVWTNLTLFRFFLPVFFSVLSLVSSAQKPNISYTSPQTVYLEKEITPISVTNTGGAVPGRIYPQVDQLFAGNPSFIQHFIKTSSGDLYGTQYASIIRVKPDGSSSVFAGTSTYGYADGLGTAALFGTLNDIINDNAGNLYVAERNSRDETNGRIRKITPSGVVSTYAQGLFSPGALAMDANGVIYVAEGPGRIMKVATDGTVSFVAGQSRVTGKANGTGAAASFYNVVAIVIGKDGNLYALESGNSLIRKITPAGVVTTFAGSNFGSADGSGLSASFWSPQMMRIDSKGNLIVADGNSLFRRISPSADVVTIGGPVYYDSNGKTKYETYYSNFIIDEDDNIEYLSGGLYRILTTGFTITPTLPAGLSLSTDGTIVGTPKAVSAATNYKIAASNESGISTYNLNLTVAVSTEPPVITSFSPTSAYTGQGVTITGSYFTGTTAVTIGGKPAASFSLGSPTSLYANVAAGSSLSGDVTVTNPYGTATLSGFTFIPPPTITAISSLSGAAGNVIKITGTNFNGVTQVNFGGYYASFTIISPTEINAVVGNYGGSGAVSVYAPSGTANFPGFTYIPAPNISTISPYSGGTGDVITITGNDLSNATNVSFGNTAASSFTVVSPTTIKAVVAAGSGNGITVTTPGGKATYSSFNYILPPAITQVYPLKGGLNSGITIIGSNLSNSQVSIGGVPAQIGYNSNNQILAYVGNGASSGNVTVTNTYGTALLAGFIWVPAPTITSFSPTTAASGDIVTITGTDLTDVGTVTIGGISSIFTILSPTAIQATVGAGASGSIGVISPGGNASLPGFSYSGPVITSFTPTSAGAGQTVVITGNNFTNASDVYFGGVSATSFIVNSPTQITAVVGLGKSGSVTVVTPLGRTSTFGFTHPGPSISFFNPVYAGTLSTSPVTIAGNNFTNATAVSFGGVPATSFTVLSPTSISAIPAASASGDVVVVTPFGKDSKPGFVWAQPPTVTAFSPAAQQSGGQVTITGTNFIGVTGVKIGGVSVSYSTFSSTSIIVYINNAVVSGSISVITISGTASIDGFIYSSPVIQSISPVVAAAGQTVTITGNNFTGIQSVNFGGVNATSFSVVSPTIITATVGTGNSGSVNISGPSGMANIAGFTFLPPPVIYSFTPSSGGSGTSVSINGSNLLTTSAVTIGGIVATVTSVTNNVVIVTVNAGASGKISLTTNAGNTEIDGFTWYPQPNITSVSPLTANGQTPVTITGNNFTGTTQVKFGSSVVAFTVLSPTQIKVSPVNASSGTITVTNPGGTASFQGFVFLPAPVITSFTTTGEGSSAVVSIMGTNFTNVTSVKFGSVEASSFTVNSPTSIQAVPGLGETGSISVTGDGGSGTIAGFLYNKPPLVLSFSRASGPIGTALSIIGDNFNPIPEKNVVYFGPVRAQVTNATKTKLEIVVPAGANNLVTVTNIDKGLTGYSNLPFMVTTTATFSGYSNKHDINFDSAVSSIAIKDFDGDGTPDFLVAKSDSLYILLHGRDKVLSKSSFTQKINLVIGKQVINMVVDDIDGDGSPDILFGTGLSIVFLRNTSTLGNVSFSTTAFESLNSSYSGMFLRDIDMDGRPDLISGTGGAYYLNTSNASKVSFGTAGYFQNTSSSSNISFTLTDIDGDNMPDPIYGSSYNGFTIFNNRAVPGSLNPQLFPTTYITHSSYYSSTLLSADFDGDNKADVLENDYGYNASNLFLVSRNIATKGTITTASLQAPQAFSNKGLIYRNGLADVDGDGKIDLMGGVNSTISYSRNLSGVGTIQFEAPVLLLSGANDNFNNYQVSDIDGDGRNDIIVLDPVNSKIAIYNNGIIPAPQITSVSPLIAAKDSTVYITGKYFDQTSVVNFGAKVAKSFRVVSPQTIIAIVGDGESGSITVQTPSGQNSFPGFIFLSPPIITSVVTATDGTGQLLISGKNFTKTTNVAITGVSAVSFIIKSDTQIEANFLASSGTLSVTNIAGTSTFTDVITVLPTPTITASGPLTFYPGGSVLLTANSEVGYTYQWLKDGVNIAGATSGTYTASQSGAYTVIVTLNGVSRTSAATVITTMFALPASNFTVTANSTTCYGLANGTITISAAQPLNYTATITGGNLNGTYPFTNTTSINNLGAGTYNVCFTIAGQNSYQQCFTVVITEPKSLAVYAAINNAAQSLNLTLDGASKYYVTLNGVTTTTTAGNMTLNLKNGVNDLTVATDKSCQGIYQKRFDLSTGILAFPNPFTSTLNVNLGNEEVSVATVGLFKITGEKVYSKQFANTSGTVQIEPQDLTPGVYILKLKTGQTEKILKVVKL
ncbi:hypothetical protein DBR40_08720 [Pedobacter sp. KBW01]|uniref:IPT/TIG domain-containing protein n=1 Tax=Pedobacter sp. KBW01 TaxID=2153364 RepID=UPI000F59A467|nr:IPT/TIG domain-containing protein [Pedobacter sp. KBW01]RQO78027.1 hypothetical protein DBR40_08720 [Pedobacter sp. KBW01]